MKFYSSDLSSFSSSLQIQPIKPSSHNSARNCLPQLLFNGRIEHFLLFTEAEGSGYWRWWRGVREVKRLRLVCSSNFPHEIFENKIRMKSFRITECSIFFNLIILVQQPHNHHQPQAGK